MPDLAKLQALLQDRNDKVNPRGRASAPFPIVLDADLAIDLSRARQNLANAEQAVTDHKAAASSDTRQGGRRKVPDDLTAAVDKAKAQVAEIKAEADDVTVQLIFVALQADENDALEKLHPPREDNEQDKQNDLNSDTFPIARMHACANRVLGMDDTLLDLDPKALATGMSTGERDLACQVVNGINGQVASVPFYAANSQSRQRNGAK